MKSVARGLNENQVMQNVSWLVARKDYFLYRMYGMLNCSFLSHEIRSDVRVFRSDFEVWYGDTDNVIFLLRLVAIHFQYRY